MVHTGPEGWGGGGVGTPFVCWLVKAMGNMGLFSANCRVKFLGLFCWLVAYRPSNMRVYLRDGSAQTILRAATLR